MVSVPGSHPPRPRPRDYTGATVVRPVCGRRLRSEWDRSTPVVVPRSRVGHWRRRRLSPRVLPPDRMERPHRGQERGRASIHWEVEERPVCPGLRLGCRPRRGRCSEPAAHGPLTGEGSCGRSVGVRGPGPLPLSHRPRRGGQGPVLMLLARPPSEQGPAPTTPTVTDLTTGASCSGSYRPSGKTWGL